MAHLFSELHRRHPDVDLVLLPPAPPRPAAPEADDDRVADTFSRVAWAARQLWSSLVPDSLAEPVARWSYAADPGRVRVLARVVERRDDGFHVLVATRHELESHGWEVTRPPGAVERLTGYLDELELTASYAEGEGGGGVLVVTVSCQPLEVGPERATALVRGTR